MHEQYFHMEHQYFFHPSWWWKVKFKLFGKKIEEFTPTGIWATWYMYKNKLYMTNYSIYK